jgi:hypothetical protein
MITLLSALTRRATRPHVSADAWSPGLLHVRASCASSESVQIGAA